MIAPRAAFKTSTRRALCCDQQPGGSRPGGYINDEIRRLRAKYRTSPARRRADLCASGAITSPSPPTDLRRQGEPRGSIGVIISGFGSPARWRSSASTAVPTRGREQDFSILRAGEPAHKDHARRCSTRSTSSSSRCARRARQAPAGFAEIFSGSSGRQRLSSWTGDGFGSLDSWPET